MMFLWTLFISTWALSLPELIIGADDRIQINQVKQAIHQSTGLIEFEDAQGSFCTGTLITPSHVLTSAHCVTNGAQAPVKFKNVQFIKFTPGKLARSHAPWGTLKAKKVMTFQEWLNKRDLNFDMAVIELEGSFALPVVKLEVQPSASHVQNIGLYLSGYGIDKNYATMWDSRGTGHGTYRKNNFLHTIDMVQGTSGGLIRKWNGSQWIGVGVNRGELRVTMFTGWNEAVLINPTIHSAILRWTQQ